MLSLPHPERYPPLSLSPQKQKEKTYEALVAWLCVEAKQQAVTYAWEDLHWADPSTLELLTLFLTQVPTTRLLAVLTYRPEFIPLWGAHSYLSQLTLSRLARSHVEVMVEKVTGGTTLSKEVVQQIVSKTDGIPLFVEELTKTVLESVESIESIGSEGRLGRSAIPLGIPATLQDALMARLDRLGPAKEIAQVGATIGCEFNYELLRAVSPLDEQALQQGLQQLVEAELVYQSGVLPQARYLFKHALVQETAYQSLLKSRRQQLHHQVARVLVDQFPDTIETQPELTAHHYTEASLIAQAIPYWQQAGQKAIERSANMEAISHLTKGLELLKTLPDTPERVQQELTLQTTLGMPLVLTKGHAAPEVEATYTRARELCRQVGETPQLFFVLLGLRRFYFMRGELQTARELGQQLLTLAQNLQDSGLLARAHMMQGEVLYYLGEFVQAREHLEQGIALYDSQQHRSDAFLYGNDTGVACLAYAASVLSFLGYLDQALKRSQEAFTRAQELSHPFSLAMALSTAATVHYSRREGQAAQKRAEALIALSTEQGFAFFLAMGVFRQGAALAGQSQGKEGIAQMRQGLAAYRVTGAEAIQPYFLALLAEAFGRIEQAEEGLNVLTESLTLVEKNGERHYEAELYRLSGELSLRMGERETGRTGEEEKITHSPIPLQRTVSRRLLKSRESNKPNPSNSVPPRALLGCGSNKASRKKLTRC